MENEITLTQIKEDIKDGSKKVVGWIKGHMKEILIGSLSSALLYALGKNANLKDQNNLLTLRIGKLEVENGCLKEMAELHNRNYLSLAGEATRCGSSLGGQILSEARYNKFS